MFRAANLKPYLIFGFAFCDVCTICIVSASVALVRLLSSLSAVRLCYSRTMYTCCIFRRVLYWTVAAASFTYRIFIHLYISGA